LALEIHVLSAPSHSSALAWRWDAETEILSGLMSVDVAGGGYTGTVELSDEDGSIVVLDVRNGVLCGIDIVVWPEVTILPGLAAPVDARAGQIHVPTRTARRGTSSLEFDTTLTMSADADERTFHLRIGTRRPVEPIRVAPQFVAEVDASQRLAGFWLEQVPPAADTA
jgi:hypothetical protein